MPANAQYADDDPPPQAGRLSYISGQVSIQPSGVQDWGQAYPNLPFAPGDRIYTDSNGLVEIQIGQSYVRVGPNSDVTLVSADPNQVSFGIGQGSIHVHSYGFWPNQALYVQSPNGAIGVNQPSEFRVDVLPDDGATVYTADNGPSSLYGAGGYQEQLAPGQAVELFGSNPVYPQWLQPAGADQLDSWSQSRDYQIARAASFRYVSREVPGAWELDASGDWTPQSEYGPIWFPRVAAGWSPYHNGRWINRDPWGWVWVEDESWGYAPFHYGRWVSYNGRWGWVPGPPAAHPVWSPALVVFAGGISVGGGGVAAWFPLGPGEAFRPWYRCSPHYVDQVNISNITPAPRVVVQRTYVNITNVNVTNITYVNRTVGVTAMPQSAMASGQPVSRAAVRVDPGMMARAQVLARPQVVPAAAAKVGPPPSHPVPQHVATQRPLLINQQGKQVAAVAHAKPVEPPVKQAPPQMRPPAGHAVVAPPATAKHPNAPQASAPTRPGQQQPNRPAQQQPGMKPTQPAQTQQRPGTQSPAPTAQKPGTQQPVERPAQPQPGRTQEPQQPAARPPAQPAHQPAQQPQRPDTTKPPQKTPEQQEPKQQAPQQRPQAPAQERPNQERPPQQPAQPNQQRPNPQQPARPNQERPNQANPQRPNPNDKEKAKPKPEEKKPEEKPAQKPDNPQ